MSTSLPLVQIKDLSSYGDKVPIPSVEGTLVSLYEVETVNKTTGAALPYPKQNGVLKAPDGSESRIAFAQEIALPLTMKGKKIRVSSAIGAHGMTGIKMDRYNKNSKFHYIYVTKSATIEEVGPSTGQPIQAQRPAQQPQSTQQTHVELDGEPMPTNEPMDDRMSDFLKTLDLWCQFIGRDVEEVMKGWGPDKISEQVTGFILSFKGKYGTHARPVFKTKSSQVPETIAKTDALIERAAAATAAGNAPLTWKDYIYKGIKLGDHSDEKLEEMIKWAETSTTSTPEAVVLRKHLLVAKAEREAAINPDAQFEGYRDGEDDNSIPF